MRDIRAAIRSAAKQFMSSEVHYARITGSGENLDLARGVLLDSIKDLVEALPPTSPDGITLYTKFPNAVPNYADYLVAPFVKKFDDGSWGYRDIDMFVPYLNDLRDGRINGRRPLEGTSFSGLLNADVPFTIPHERRFEHTWFVARSGHGKTNALHTFVERDLRLLERGEASLVVIDSAAAFIDTIAHLKVFAPGQPLHGKLILIDPGNVDQPFALAPFAMPKRMARYSPADREAFENQAIDLLTFMVSGLGREMTDKQRSMFKGLLRALIGVPGATLKTLYTFLDVEAQRRDPSIIEDAPPLILEFLRQTDRDYRETREQVFSRLKEIFLESPAFERLMCNATSEFDMFSALNEGSVILVYTNRRSLQSATRAFGRLFLAMIGQAAYERDAPGAKRLPAFVYCDEFADYAGQSDQNVTDILAQARQRKIAFTAAHQFISPPQLHPHIYNGLRSNTAIKIMGSMDAADAARMGRELGISAESLQTTQRGTFYVHIAGERSAKPTEFPLAPLASLPRMSEPEYETVLNEIAQRYSAKPSATSSSPVAKPVSSSSPAPKTPTASPADADDIPA